MMRFLDLWVGGPLCLLLSLLARLRGIVPARPPRRGRVRSVLVMKFFGMGSILLSEGLFSALRGRHAGARIDFLTFSSNRDLCGLMDPADRYYFLRTGNLALFLFDLAAVLWRIRRVGYDLAVDMEFFSNFSMIVSVLSGARERTGYYARRPGRESLLDRPVYFNRRLHVTEVFRSLAEGDGIARRDGCRPLHLRPSHTARAAARELIGGALGNGGGRAPLIAININVSGLCTERHWPDAHFIRLSRRILRSTRAVLLFIGGPEDADHVRGVVASLGASGRSARRVIDISGRTGLEVLLGVLERCALLITNDSGPLHLAVSAGVRTASFFGPETPAFYGPLGRDHAVFYRGLYCSPCLNVYNAKIAMCDGDNRCMKAIGPDEAYEGIRSRFPDIWGR